MWIWLQWSKITPTTPSTFRRSSQRSRTKTWWRFSEIDNSIGRLHVRSQGITLLCCVAMLSFQILRRWFVGPNLHWWRTSLSILSTVLTDVLGSGKRLQKTFWQISIARTITEVCTTHRLQHRCWAWSKWRWQTTIQQLFHQCHQEPRAASFHELRCW